MEDGFQREIVDSGGGGVKSGDGLVGGIGGNSVWGGGAVGGVGVEGVGRRGMG